MSKPIADMPKLSIRKRGFWSDIRFWFWRRRVAGMLHHWFKWPVPVAWHYAGCMDDYFAEGFAPEDAIEEDRQYWGEGR